MFHWDRRKQFVISGILLYQISFYQGSTVPIGLYPEMIKVDAVDLIVSSKKFSIDAQCIVWWNKHNCNISANLL